MQTIRPLIVAIAGLTIAGLTIAGCTVFEPVASHSVPPTELTPPPTCSPDEVAALPEGALVAIGRNSTENVTRTTVGTVLKASSEGVALMNCRVESRSVRGTPILSKTPYVNRYFKNTGVGTTRIPVLWVPQHEMTAVRIVQPPPADYVASDLALDTTTYGDEFERIGIDFDFTIPSDVPPGTVVSIDHIERTVVPPSR